MESSLDIFYKDPGFCFVYLKSVENKSKEFPTSIQLLDLVRHSLEGTKVSYKKIKSVFMKLLPQSNSEEINSIFTSNELKYLRVQLMAMETKCANEKLMQILKSQILVDKVKVSNFKMYPEYFQILTEEDFLSNIIPTINKLSMRSEKNFYLFSQFLISDFKFDLSSIALETIGEVVGNCLFTVSDPQIIANISKNFVSKIKNEEIADKVTEILLKMGFSTSEEKKKLLIMSILVGMSQMKSIQKKILSFVIDSSQIMTEESIEQVQEFTNEIGLNYDMSCFTEDIFNKLKKNLASANKCLLTSVISFLNGLLSNENSIGKVNDKCLELITKSLIPIHISSFVKAPQKIAGQFQISFFAVAVTCKIEKELIGESNLADICKFLTMDAPISQIQFLNRISKIDSENLFLGFLNYFSKINFPLTLELGSTLAYLLSKSESFITKKLKECQNYSLSFLKVILSAIWTISFQKPNYDQNECLKFKAQAFRILIHNFDLFEKKDFPILLFSLGNCYIEKLHGSFLMENDKQMEIINESILENQNEIHSFLLNNEDSFSKIRIDAKKKLFSFLCKFEARFEIFKGILSIISLDSFEEGDERMEKLEETKKHSNSFRELTSKLEFVLNKSGTIDKKVETSANTTQTKPNPNASKKAGKKPVETNTNTKKSQNESLGMIHDEEALKLMNDEKRKELREISFSMIHFYLEIMSSLCPRYTFEKVLPIIEHLFIHLETRSFIFPILKNLFTNTIMSAYLIEIIDLLTKLWMDLTPNQNYTEKLKPLLQKFSANKLSFSDSENKFWLHLFLKMLENNEIDFNMKAILLGIMNTWLAYCPWVANDLYQVILRNLDSFSFSPILIELIRKLVNADNYIDLFEKLLLINESAQLLCVKAVCENIGTPNFTSFFKLKIIEKTSYNEEILKISRKMQENLTFQDFSLSDLKNFNFGHFIRIHEREYSNAFSDYTKDLAAIHSEAISVIVDSIFSETKILSKEEETPEETLEFIPYFLQNNKDLLKNFEMVKKSLDLIIVYLTNESQENLLQSCLATGIALIKIIDNQENLSQLLAFLTNHLDNKNLTPSNHLAAVVFIGVCAPLVNNTKESNVSAKIVNLMHTSSHSNQKALGSCLPELIKFFGDSKKMVTETLDKQKKEKCSVVQRGNAYLIAGLIKANGVKTIEDSGIMEFVKSTPDKTDSSKTGILWILYALIDVLAKVFEPFVPDIIEIVMQFFGDIDDEIRKLSLDTTRELMSILSGYGVKLLLPILLKGLEEKSSWRAKLANIWALGNMSYCSPKQLSACLPLIISKLSIVLSDTHEKIRVAAYDALTVIASTVKNPEVTENIKIIIKALSDPFYQNKYALEVLLNQKFNHYIDFPALSLLVPILENGIKSRDTLQKEQSCHFIATMSPLIKDSNDLIAYRDILLEGLQVGLSDSLSDVRGLSSKALGALCMKLGPNHIDPIIMALLNCLNKESTVAIERAGNAQALAEILYRIGPSLQEKIIPVVLKNCLAKEHFIREGYMGILLYLPNLMEENFEVYLNEAIENVLETIAEENEHLRNMSLKVLKNFILKFGRKSPEILLTPINRCLLDSNWMKRCSSVQLIGEFLLILKEDEVMRNESLSFIYYLKYDPVMFVRNKATEVWKTSVVNIPKTMRKILSFLVQKSIILMMKSDDITHMAEEALLDFFAKYSEKFGKEYLDHLSQIMNSNIENKDIKRGVFLVIAYMCKVSSHDSIQKVGPKILEFLQSNIEESEELLRVAIYSTLRNFIAKNNDYKSILDPLLSPYLPYLDYEDDQNVENYEDKITLFSELIRLSSERIDNYLNPKLLRRPFSNFQLDILKNNAEIYSPRIYCSSDFEDLIIILYHEAIAEADELKYQSYVYTLGILASSMQLESQIKRLLVDFIKETKLSDKKKCKTSLKILANLIENLDFEEIDVSEELIGCITPHLFNQDAEVQDIVLPAIRSLLNPATPTPFENYSCFMTFLRTCLETKPDVNIFKSKDLLDNILEGTIYNLVYGETDNCTEALELYSYIVKSTDEETLSIYSMKMIGPLIRISSYKYIEEVKSQILFAISKFPLSHIRVFSPQLHSVYQRLILEIPNCKQLIKNFSDLIRVASRRDLMMNELLKKGKESFNEEVQISFFNIVYHSMKRNNDMISVALLENFFGQISNSDGDYCRSDSSILALARVLSKSAESVGKQEVKTYLEKCKKELLEGSTDFNLICNSLLVSLVFPDEEYGNIFGKTAQNAELEDLLLLEKYIEMACDKMNSFREWVVNMGERIKKEPKLHQLSIRVRNKNNSL